jgi:hypothetical protein
MTTMSRFRSLAELIRQRSKKKQLPYSRCNCCTASTGTHSTIWIVWPSHRNCRTLLVRSPMDACGTIPARAQTGSSAKMSTHVAGRASTNCPPPPAAAPSAHSCPSPATTVTGRLPAATGHPPPATITAGKGPLSDQGHDDWLSPIVDDHGWKAAPGDWSSPAWVMRFYPCTSFSQNAVVRCGEYSGLPYGTCPGCNTPIMEYTSSKTQEIYFKCALNIYGVSAIWACLRAVTVGDL